MQRATQARVTILRRISELDVELQQARTALKNLRTKDPATGEVVLRGARLSREKAELEMRLERLSLDPTQLPAR